MTSPTLDTGTPGSYANIAINPHGHLTWIPDGGDHWPVPEAATRCAEAFAKGSAALLMHLASREFETLLPPAPAFWRAFARRYFAALCHLPESDIPHLSPPAPSDAEWESFLNQAPPMPGLEYLTLPAIHSLWMQLDASARAAATAHPQGPGGFLRTLHPAWRAVGRVCFHLAQNKKDENRPFAFLATYATGVGTHGQVQYRPLGQALQEYAGAKNRAALLKLLSPVKAASESSPLVRELLETGALYSPLAWSPREALRFLKEIPAIEAGGIRIRVPDLWKNNRPSRPRVQVAIGDQKRSGMGLGTLLSFEMDVALNGQPLSKSEIAQLLSSTDGLALIRGQWVEVDPDKLQHALDHWSRVDRNAPDGLSLAEGLRHLSGAQVADPSSEPGLEEWAGLVPGAWLDRVLANLRDPARLDAIAAIPGLRATLRPYQSQGVAWLSFMRELGLGACLADDMGLGKTLQLIALLLLQPAGSQTESHRPSLLVAPASLLANWMAELARFAPGLRARILHPSAMAPDEWKQIQSRPEPAVQNSHLALTTYGMVARWTALRALDWNLVALDEAQAIKNPSTRQTRAVKELRGRHRVALTGTPIENRLGDLWSLFDFLNPGLLGSARAFSDFAKRADDPSVIGAIRTLARPYILRRMKSDKRIIADLPDKTEVSAFCSLSKAQTVLYGKSVEELSVQLEQTDGIQRRGLVLSYILRFKQICNHPSQWLRDGQYDPAASGKFARLAELADEIAARQEKTLVFTQFQEIAAPLESFLAGLFRRPGLILHGGTPVKERRKLVDTFQHEDGPPFFVLTTKAGGSGLNLTEASHVIHFDRWWNPAVENQATDRAFRIGQKKNVLVHKFVCQGTIEERIDAMIAEKTALAGEILEGAGAEKMLTEMDNRELIRFVSLDINKAAAAD